MEDVEAASQSSQETLTNDRGPQTKRRRSGNKASQDSQQTEPKLASTSQPKRRRSRKSDALSQSQQDTTQEQANDVDPAVEESQETNPPSQARRSRRRGNDSETGEPFVEVELPRRTRRKAVAVAIEQPSQQNVAAESTQLTPQSNKTDDPVAGQSSSEPAQEPVSDPAQSLILQLQAMLEDAKGLQLSQEAEETASDLAFQLQREIAKAGRRSRA